MEASLQKVKLKPLRNTKLKVRLISAREKMEGCDVTTLPYMDIKCQSISIYQYGYFVTSLLVCGYLVMLISGIRGWKTSSLWRHKFAIYLFGYKLIIHLNIWWFFDVTYRMLFVCGNEYFSFELGSLVRFSENKFVWSAFILKCLKVRCVWTSRWPVQVHKQ